MSEKMMDADQFGDAVDAAVRAASDMGHAVSVAVASEMLRVAIASQPVGVPDGYVVVPVEPTPEMLAGMIKSAHGYDADIVPTYMHLAYNGALAAAPTVKAEQVQCDTCHGQGEICVGQKTFGYMSMQPPEPIMEVCPECGGEEAPSLQAAGLADLIAEAERCLFVLREIGSMDADDITGDDVDLRFEDDEGRDTGCDVSIVDYAEKSADVIEKLIAALSAQQSAPERVSVPRDLLADLISSDHDTKIQAERALYALLASHAEGGKV